jgi:hypothetical protein
MASCFDLGDPDPLNAMGLCHSRYKTECGRRLALSLMDLLPPNLGKAVAGGVDVATAAVASSPSITNVTVLEKGTVVELTVRLDVLTRS